MRSRARAFALPGLGGERARAGRTCPKHNKSWGASLFGLCSTNTDAQRERWAAHRATRANPTTSPRPGIPRRRRAGRIARGRGKFYEKQLAERDARIAALEQVLKEKGVAVPEQKEKKPAVTSAFDKELIEAVLDLSSPRRASVEALLAKGADAKAVDKDEYTPLHYAAREHPNAIVDTLLAYGGDEQAWATLARGKATARSSTRCSHTAQI